MTPKLKKIILTILVLVILFVVYAIFIKPDPSEENLVTTEGAQSSEEVKILANQITQALLKIEQIKLDKSIFESELFKSLTDRSQPIAEEPIGRANPFAPIGEISVSSTVKVPSSSTSTSTSTNPPPATNTPAPKTTTSSSTPLTNGALN